MRMTAGAMKETFQSRSGGAGEENSATFNPTRLAIARKRRGFTKAELAKKLSLTPRAVTAYETGEYPPSAETLNEIAFLLDFPKSFFQGDDLDELLPDAVSFRSLSKMTARQRDMATSQGSLAIHLARWMDKRFELPVCSLPDLSHESNPEVAADYLRQHWGIGQKPVRNMIHLLESKGIRVFSISVDTREVDAFSTWKGEVPYVFLNGYKSTEHSRFDAAHELCHLVMHRHGAPTGRQAEQEANRFASAFLMPRGGVLAERIPRFITISELRRMKKKWTVSVAAMNHRLHELNLSSEWHYTGLWIEIGKRGYKVNEPEGAPREVSLILPKLFANLYQEDGMSRSRIANELGLSVAELESLLFSLVITGMNGGRSTDKRPGNPALLTRVK